jgi:hypothetical protein
MRSALLAGFAYFALAFAAGFALGTVRLFVLVPRLGETPAVALELPVMLAVCWWLAGVVPRRLGVPRALRTRVAMGASALAWLLGAEAALAIGVLGRTPAEHAAHYGTLAGALGLAGQVAFAAFPALRRDSAPS